MSKSWNRRDLMKVIGGVAGTSAAGALLAHATAGQAQTNPAPSMRKVPWPYSPLDPDPVAQRSFESYYKFRCMYGAFESIVGTTAEKLGAPYTDFPFELFKFGEGGINGWGTICGAISGCAAAFCVLSPKPDVLIDTLFSWYETEPLPNVRPKGSKFPEVRVVAGSPLCHQSLSRWSKASKKKIYSDERSERCASITASAVHKSILLLNEQAKGTVLPAVVLPGKTPGCMTCHEKGGVLENTRGKQECGVCHTALPASHPKKL